MNLNNAIETDDCYIVNGVVVLETLLSTSASVKPIYTGDNITSVVYYNSLTQVDANRIAEVVLTYTGDLVSKEVSTIYTSDGVTVFQVQTIDYIYTGDNVTKVLGTVT